MGTVTKMPRAALSNITRVLNRLMFQKSRIRDAATFILKYDGDLQDALTECAQQHPDFGIFEIEVLNMIVEEVLRDRIRQAEKT